MHVCVWYAVWAAKGIACVARREALTAGVDAPYSCNYNQLALAEESSMFETFAVLSTLTCIVIFVVLYQVDRSARREETAKNDQVPDQRS